MTMDSGTRTGFRTSQGHEIAMKTCFPTRKSCLVALTLVLVGAESVRAATNRVSFGNFFFNPSKLSFDE
jgi:hypothetical protein